MKHAGFVLRRDGMRALRNHGFAAYDAVIPYTYDPSRYELDFLEFSNPPDPLPMQEELPRQIFVVWSGDNEMSRNRREGIDSIRATNPELEVILVTPENLESYVVPGHPLHPAYGKLSFVHRSDYLQSYLLHHHGGGYTGLKRHPTPWRSAFEDMDSDPDAWITGYRIPTVREATVVRGRLGRDIHHHYRSLIGTGGMVARAHSPLTWEWYCEADRRMDYYSTLLDLHPGNVWGDNEGYPIPWTTLASQILEPLCLKYLDHVRIDDVVKPQLFDHR